MELKDPVKHTVMPGHSSDGIHSMELKDPALDLDPIEATSWGESIQWN